MLKLILLQIAGDGKHSDVVIPLTYVHREGHLVSAVFLLVDCFGVDLFLQVGGKHLVDCDVRGTCRSTDRRVQPASAHPLVRHGYLKTQYRARRYTVGQGLGMV